MNYFVQNILKNIYIYNLYIRNTIYTNLIFNLNIYFKYLLLIISKIVKYIYNLINNIYIYFYFYYYFFFLLIYLTWFN